MTPKEKAQELVTKYMPVVGCDNKIQDDFEYQRAKLCALIAVNFAWTLLKPHDDLPEINYSKIAELKSEIEKL